MGPWLFNRSLFRKRRLSSLSIPSTQSKRRSLDALREYQDLAGASPGQLCRVECGLTFVGALCPSETVNWGDLRQENGGIGRPVRLCYALLQRPFLAFLFVLDCLLMSLGTRSRERAESNH